MDCIQVTFRAFQSHTYINQITIQAIFYPSNDHERVCANYTWAQLLFPAQEQEHARLWKPRLWEGRHHHQQHHWLQFGQQWWRWQCWDLDPCANMRRGCEVWRRGWLWCAGLGKENQCKNKSLLLKKWRYSTNLLLSRLIENRLPTRSKSTTPLVVRFEITF